MYVLIGIFLLSMLWMSQEEGTAQEMNWTKFESIVAQKRVKSIKVYRGKNRAEAVLVDTLSREEIKALPHQDSSPFGLAGSAAPKNKIAAQIPSPDKFEDNVKSWREQGVFTGEVEYVEGSNDLSMILYTFGPIILLVALWFFLLRRMGGAGGGNQGGGGDVDDEG